MTRTREEQIAKLAQEQRDICRKSRLPGVLDNESRARLIHVTKEITMSSPDQTAVRIERLEAEIRQIKSNTQRSVADDDKALMLEGQIEVLREQLAEQESAGRAEARNTAETAVALSGSDDHEIRAYFHYLKTDRKSTRLNSSHP